MTADAPPLSSEPTVVCLVGESEARAFSLRPLERARRLFGRAGAVEVRGPTEPLPTHGRAVLVRLDAVLDDALGAPLLAGRDLAVLATDDGPPLLLACSVDASRAAAARDALLRPWIDEATLADLGLDVLPPDEMARLAYRKALRKSDPPYALPASRMPLARIEHRMFMASYKGVTDVVTKHLFPPLALPVVRWCAAVGLSPNAVTLVSFLCVVAATVCFAYGWFLPGLAFAWGMCFLDTVDGKLARVTLTSSKWGNVFDHGTDLVHPPFWWFAWYWGVTRHLGFPPMAGMEPAMWIVLAGYILGRIEEGIFLAVFKFEIHTWERIDSLFRQVTARRNPNLVILLVFTLFGRPDVGLFMVAVWTAISIGFHAARIGQAYARRNAGGAVRPWLAAAGD